MIPAEHVPSRAGLLRHLERTNRHAVAWVIGQVGLIGVIAALTDWARVAEQPFVSAVAVFVVIGPYFMGVLELAVIKRVEIGGLKEKTRFGMYDKDRLRSLFQDTLYRLGLPEEGLPVYITADKSLNAGALHLGLGGFLKSLNGVYLNRQLLHRLEPDEVQGIMGHELGHYYKYYLISDRFRGINLIFGGLLGLSVSQHLGLSGYAGAFGICGSGWLFWYLSGIHRARTARAIEYLCDDLGAQVHSPIVSINGLLKLGADAELVLAIQLQQLRTRKFPNLQVRDIIAAVESAIPYGHTSPEALDAAVQQALKQRARKQESVSLTGFLDFAWRGDDDSDAEEQLEALHQLQSLPRLEWEALREDPDRPRLDESQIEQLVDLMEQHSEQVLFRLPEAVGETDGVHPSIPDRIRYLWYNRDAIAEACQQQ